MECVGIAFAVLVLAAPLVLAGFAFQRLAQLQSRLQHLEAELEALRCEVRAGSAAAPAPPAPQVTVTPSAEVPAAARPASPPGPARPVPASAPQPPPSFGAASHPAAEQPTRWGAGPAAGAAGPSAPPARAPEAGPPMPAPAAAASPLPPDPRQLPRSVPSPAPPPPAQERRRLSLEELLGGHLLIWIGSVALALAGAFLVKLSFEHGWISPTVRVSLGVLFGLGLLAGGEGTRRNSGRISQALSAAGVADLFACFLAASNTYHLIPAQAGFLFMALTALVAVLLSLRQGVMVAVIGLIGGFLTPALIRTEHPSARNLVAYLLLLVVALLAVSRRRGWGVLGGAAVGCGLLWVLAWMGMSAGAPRPGDALWLSLFLLALAAAAAAPRRSWDGGGPHAAGARGEWVAGGTTAEAQAAEGAQAGPAAPDAGAVSPAAHPGAVSPPALPWSLAAALPVLALVTAWEGYSLQEWAFLGLLAAAALVLAWRDPLYEPMAWVAAGVAAMTLAGWQMTAAVPPGPDRFRAVALSAGLLFAGAGWAGALAFIHWPGARPRPDRWAAFSAASAFVFFLLAWAGSRNLLRMLGGPLAVGGGRAGAGAAATAAGTGALGAPAGGAATAGTAPDAWPAGAWGALALAIAALYLASLLPFIRRREDRRLEAAAAAFAVAVTGFVSLAVPIELERQWISVAWALEMLALVELAGRFRMAALARLGRLLALGVAVRLLLNPEVLSYPIGELPVWNWLLYGYGLPLAAFALAARRVRTQGLRARPARDAAELEWGAVAFAFVLVTLEISQAFHPGKLGAGEVGFAEAGALAGGWLLLGWGLLGANRGPRLPSLELAGRLLVALGTLWALAGPGLVANPLWNRSPVGDRPVLNLLLVVFGGLIALVALAAAELGRRGATAFAALLGGAAQLLAFLLVTLEVRQAFHGSLLAGPSTAGERYAYSAAWVVFGLALLLAGLLRRSGGFGRPLRYGSLAVMLAAVGKVFLYDTARLSDLYRVFSFLGLGASLLLLAFLYQRFVFRTGSPGGRGAALVLAALLLGGAEAEAKVQGFEYGRPVEVPAPGWVRVPLDLAALRHLAGGLRLTAPSGEEVPLQLAAYLGESERRPVKVSAVREQAAGWVLALDLGPSPPLHERLFFSFSKLAAAPAVALEASADGEHWEPLATGDLFRLGSEGNLARTALPYPPSDRRYLRLSWPRQAGFPQLDGIEVEIVPDRSLLVASAGGQCRSAAAEQGFAAEVCRLPLPAAGQTLRRLTVAVRGAGPIGYRLRKPGHGTWQLLAEGVWQESRTGSAAAGTRHSLPMPPEPIAGEPLRLELYGAPGQEPRLAGYNLELVVQTVLFHADQAGRYLLTYGGEGNRRATPGAGGPPAASAGADVRNAVSTGANLQNAAPSGTKVSNAAPSGADALNAAPTGANLHNAAPSGANLQNAAPAAADASNAAPAAAAWILPGAETRAALPPLPASATAPAASLAGVRFRGSWPVTAPGAAAGDLVRLELPNEVYAQARTDLGDLRLASEGRQIPYVRWSPAEPVPVLERADLRPIAEKGRQYSRLEVALPAAALPLTALDLAAPPAPLHRPIGVRYPTPGPAGLAPREERVVARESWDCMPQPPLPCQATLPLMAPGASHLALRLADGDNPPLPRLDLAVWRRDDVLIFAWPEQGKVHLLSGAEGLEAPVYDLSALADSLRGQPWVRAELAPGEDAGAGEGRWWHRWLLPATLAAAGGGLLLLLRRILAQA